GRGCPTGACPPRCWTPSSSATATGRRGTAPSWRAGRCGAPPGGGGGPPRGPARRAGPPARRPPPGGAPGTATARRGGGGGGARERLDSVVLTAGCHTPDDRCPPVLAREIERHQRTIVIASAGNDGTERPFWPAASPSVIGVGATGADGTLASFSNRGDWVDA